jgi:alkaline phosphatase D
MKKRFVKRFALFIAVAITISIYGCKTTKKGGTPDGDKPYLIMLSLDGFRWDYPLRFNTPVLDSLASVGVFAELKPCFPSKTFPNHYSIATGLYPDHHGIVLNNFYAPLLHRNYSITDRNSVRDGVFYGGEPLWVTAQKQHLNNAVLFWVGSEADIRGIAPQRRYNYNQSLPFESRIDSITTWLNLPPKIRPHLILWYYHEPDHTGHIDGPYGTKTKETVEQLDKWLGTFFNKMRKLPDFDKFNFIITSDHGMGEISSNKVLLLDKLIDTSDIEIINGGNPVFNLKVKAGRVEKVYGQLKKCRHISVWKHNGLPPRLHYGTNPRTLDLTVVADTTWSLYLNEKDMRNEKGTHGYDNNWRAMHAIFYAAGPAFKKGYRHHVFENINIYPLVTHILNLKPAKTDGNFNTVKEMLK